MSKIVPKPNPKHAAQMPAKVRIAVWGWRGRPQVSDEQVEAAIREGLAQDLRATIWERNHPGGRGGT